MILEQCCCFDLRTGVLITAFLSWGFTCSKIFTGNTAGVPEGFFHPSGTFYLFKIVFTVLALIACIFLVIGVYQENSSHFRPWLGIAALECVLTTIFTIVCFLFIFIKSSTAFYIEYFLILLGYSIIGWYLWLVVYSYYREVEEEN